MRAAGCAGRTRAFGPRAGFARGPALTRRIAHSSGGEARPRLLPMLEPHGTRLPRREGARCEASAAAHAQKVAIALHVAAVGLGLEQDDDVIVRRERVGEISSRASTAGRASSAAAAGPRQISLPDTVRTTARPRTSAGVTPSASRCSTTTSVSGDRARIVSSSAPRTLRGDSVSAATIGAVRRDEGAPRRGLRRRELRGTRVERHQRSDQHSRCGGVPGQRERRCEQRGISECALYGHVRHVLVEGINLPRRLGHT